MLSTEARHRVQQLADDVAKGWIFCKIRVAFFSTNLEYSRGRAISEMCQRQGEQGRSGRIEWEMANDELSSGGEELDSSNVFFLHRTVLYINSTFSVGYII